MKNKSNFSLIAILLLVTTMSILSCQTEPVDLSPTTGNTATVDPQLFDLLEKVTKSTEGNPAQRIVCIDFIYPFKVYIYNSNLEIIGEQAMTGDEQLSAFLGTITSSQSISISYPISTTFADGSVFVVNNNTELKLAIDNCSKEDIIAYCNDMFLDCVWKIPYSQTGDNKYVSGLFDADDDGTLHFQYNDNEYTGTWVFLFINDELHMNINLEGSSPVAQYWNIDRMIEINGSEFTIINSPKNIILKKSCQVTNEYQIGDTGPSNGIVFYDKGSYSLGWRYIEVATEDLELYEWGCANSSIAEANNTGIGKGLYNTAAIVNFHDNLDNYYSNPSICNSQNNGTVAAKNAIQLVSGYNDWFLPSTDELNLIYTNLHLQGLGNLSNSTYWSSTEIGESTVNTILFETGEILTSSKIPSSNTIKTRAIRYF